MHFEGGGGEASGLHLAGHGAHLAVAMQQAAVEVDLRSTGLLKQEHQRPGAQAVGHAQAQAQPANTGRLHLGQQLRVLVRVDGSPEMVVEIGAGPGRVVASPKFPAVVEHGASGRYCAQYRIGGIGACLRGGPARRQAHQQRQHYSYSDKKMRHG